MQIAGAFVDIRANQSNLDRDLGEIERKVEGSAKSSAGKFASIFGSLAVGAGIKKLIDSSSDLEQAVGGTAAVFGEAGSAIDEFAKDSATSAGLSQRAARELTSQLGGLLSGFGFTKKEAASLSIELTKLGGDLSATFGGKPEEAVQALGAAMRGETDPIERYGISLNQAAVNAKAVELGLASSTSTVDANAKAQATLAIITEKSAGAQGQFAREADSAAGKAAITAAKTEDAAASMGDSLLPIYGKAVGVIGSLADGFGALPDAVQTGIVALAGVAAVAPRVVDGVRAIGDVASKVPGFFDKISSGAGTVTGKLANLNPALGLAGAAVGVAALAVYANSLNSTEIDVDKLVVATANLTDENRKQLEGTVEAAASMGKLDDVVKKIAGTNVEAAERFIEVAEAAGINKEELDKLRQITDEKRDADIQGKVDQENYTQSQEEGTEAAKAAAGALEEQRVKLEELTAAVVAAFDSNLGYRQAVDGTSDALANLTTLTKEGKAGTEDYSDQLLAAEGAALRQAGAAVKLAEDQAKANGTTVTGAEKNRIYRDELQNVANTLAPGSPLRAQLEAYIAQLNDLDGKNVNTTVTTTYTKREDRSYYDNAKSRALALGGPVEAGDMVRVGESGPEMVQFGQAGTVIPNHDLARGGGTTFNGPVTIISEATRARDVYDETLWRVAG